MLPPLSLIDTQMDQSIPYYVHSSDGSSTVNVTPILGGSNYHSWAGLMRCALGVK